MFEAILWTDGVRRGGTAANHRHAGGGRQRNKKKPNIVAK